MSILSTGHDNAHPAGRWWDTICRRLETFRRAPDLVTLERIHEDADVLVVTSGWPRPENPVHCVFIRRQMDSLADRGVRYETLFIHGYRSRLAYFIAAARLAALNGRAPRYRLVHAHGGEAALAAYCYRRGPVLASYLGGDLLGNAYTPDAGMTVGARLTRAIIRYAACFATATITKSRQMEQALPRRARLRNSVIPNGVDVHEFRPMDHALARRRLGWPADDRIVLFVGDPNELRKRHALAAAAVDKLGRSLPGVRLVVVHGIDPSLTPIYMNAADCLVLLSWMEGSPNVVKEALMCNLPVVATPVGDVPDLLRDVRPSFLVEPTVDSVVRALSFCLRTPLRSNGRVRSARLASDVIATEVQAIYDRISQARP